jgi:hypothetical protein
MKKCPYCGKEYPNEASECAIDGQPLEPFPPEPTPTDDGSCNEVKTVVIHAFTSHEAAQLAASNLEAHGIGCWVSADDCSGMYPNLTAPSGVRLSVATSDAEAAVALLNAQASPVEIKQAETEAVASSSPEPVSPRKAALARCCLAWSSERFLEFSCASFISGQISSEQKHYTAIVMVRLMKNGFIVMGLWSNF